MPPTPSQIKELLLSAIDGDENITDMGSIINAITLLESNPITKDALEETRLARLVQVVRKKANSNLKKRCTALIKQWRSQFMPPNAVKTPKTDSPAPNQDEAKGHEGSSTSDGQKSKPAKQTTNTIPVDKSKSENLRRRKRDAEGSPSISPSSRGPPPKKLVSSRGQSPLLHEEGNGQDDSSLNGVSAKGDCGRGRTTIKDAPRTASPQTSTASPKSKPSISKDKGSLKKLKQERSASPKSRAKDATTNSVSPALTPNKQLLVRKREDNSSPGVIVTLGDKRPKISLGSGPPTSSKKSKGPSPKSSNNISSSSSPVVKGENSSSKSGSLFVTDWDTADFRSEGETSLNSVALEHTAVPTTSSKSSSIFDLDFSECMQPEQSRGSLFDAPVSPSPDENDMPVQSTFDEESTKEVSEAKDEGSPAPVNVPAEVQSWSSPPQMETLEDEPPTPPAPVLEGDIDRIHTKHWEGVNGCFNNKGDWFDWMQCLTVDTDEENSIQILPYVCID